MERLKNLDCYQKGILIFMIAITLIFTILYPLTLSRVGFQYKEAILVQSQESGSTVYSGKLWGKNAHFTVLEDKTVEFQYDGKTYGPYTAKEDPSAVPQDVVLAEHMTGVELRDGDSILFRGGVFETNETFLLYNEDGSLENIGFSYVDSHGLARDDDGDLIDPAEPSASAILSLMNGPELTHKGEAVAWFGAVFVCAVNALSILFADELFRLSLASRIRDADNAEPSDFEIAGRYIGWTALAVIALLLFIVGLR